MLNSGTLMDALGEKYGTNLASRYHDRETIYNILQDIEGYCMQYDISYEIQSGLYTGIAAVCWFELDDPWGPWMLIFNIEE